jgi:hypothetical protein
MALTIETLKGKPVLATLTPEQLSAIVALSVSDEDTVIGARVGEIHGSYEKDILALTGIPKNQGEKAYDYNKRVLSQYKTEAETAKTTVETIKAEKAAIEQKLKAGSTDEALKSQLADLSTKLKDAQDALKAKDSMLAKVVADHKSELTNAKVNFQFMQTNKDIKLKAAYSDTIAQTLLSQAKNEILARYIPDFIDVNGQETLIFRDKTTNEIARNPNNGLNPYSIKDLYQTTVLKEAIDTGKKQTGGGTGNPTNTGANPSGIDLSGVKTQKEADNMIYTHLMQKGLARGTQEFSAEQAKIRAENEINKLPIR